MLPFPFINNFGSALHRSSIKQARIRWKARNATPSEHSIQSQVTYPLLYKKQYLTYRPPLEFTPVLMKKNCRKLVGVCEEPFKLMAKFEKETPPLSEDQETRKERKERLWKESILGSRQKVVDDLKNYKPKEDPNARGDPYKTIFLCRISKKVTPAKLKKEFEEYGPIKRVSIIFDKDQKSRGYAFIEYEHLEDFKRAYKLADGKKIEDKRITVDLERGRVIPDWKPRRLGGGKGETRRSKKMDRLIKYTNHRATN